MFKPCQYSPRRIDEISAGYDLDCGGHEFESLADEGFPWLLKWIDPDPDTMPWIGCQRKFYSVDRAVYVFAPEDYDMDWPVWHQAACGDTYYLQYCGTLNSTDHDCYCEKENRDKTQDGEPSCGRPGCLDGILESVGGSWAIYGTNCPPELRVQKYVEAVTHNTEGMNFISFGYASGCDECRSYCDEDSDEEADRMIEDGEIFDEGHFSWHFCGLCGCPLGGDRHTYHWVDDNDHVVHDDDACTDCMIYISNGETPDPDYLDWI